MNKYLLFGVSPSSTIVRYFSHEFVSKLFIKTICYTEYFSREPTITILKNRIHVGKIITFQSQREKTYFLTCSPNEDSNQPAQSDQRLRFMKKAASLHYENTPIQMYWKFYHQKMKIFREKNLIFFIDEAVLTSTHNLCFEQNKKNNAYPCKPQFYYIKVGFKGVKII